MRAYADFSAAFRPDSAARGVRSRVERGICPVTNRADDSLRNRLRASHGGGSASGGVRLHHAALPGALPAAWRNAESHRLPRAQLVYARGLRAAHDRGHAAPQPFLFSARGNEPAPVEDFLGRELPAYIDSHYRTVNDRRARAIAGISMGGYGATLLGVKRHDMFGAVGAISAALATGNRRRDLGAHIAALMPGTAPYFYIACGVADPVITASRDLSTQLVKGQIRSELKEVPGGHGWEVWDPQVRAFLDVLAKLPGWSPREQN